MILSFLIAIFIFAIIFGFALMLFSSIKLLSIIAGIVILTFSFGALWRAVYILITDLRKG